MVWRQGSHGGVPVLVPGSDSRPHIAIETRPNLWAEAESLLEPWANMTLMCKAVLETTDFQLFKDGVLQEHVHLDLVATQHRFPLGAIMGDTQGLYRCRSGMNSGWTELSNLLEVTGAGEHGLLWGWQAVGRRLQERPFFHSSLSLSSSSVPPPHPSS